MMKKLLIKNNLKKRAKTILKIYGFTKTYFSMKNNNKRSILFITGGFEYQHISYV